MKIILLLILLTPTIYTVAQIPDKIYQPNIHSVKLFQQNNQESVALINLNSSDQLELHFDDLDDNVKNYYYSYQLCDADWKPADLSSFDYISGYQQQRLSLYRVSSIALTKYIHYQALLPTINCMPTKSGNYLLKVYLNGDTAQLAFTKRLFVIDNKAVINGRIMQPFDNEITQTHQKLQFSVDATPLNAPNPAQQIKVAAIQNYKWDEALLNLQPAFIRGSILEYNGEQDCLFESGKEFRWADLRSFRFQSDRVQGVDKTTEPNTIYLKPDYNLNTLRYIFYQDYNGWMDISTTESVNNWWQTDYANVVFTYIPSSKQPIIGKDLYIIGELTQNKINEESKMKYNAEKGVYQKELLLKQGYYNYSYATKDNSKPELPASPAISEGNYWETENDYIIFVYYRSYSGRHDELVGMKTINSITGRAGL